VSVEENTALIRAEINEACARVGRASESVHIIAVTKYVSERTAQAALDAGIKHIGENRDDGFLKKYEALGEEPVWHFIGTLQSRKVKNMIDKINYIHSLDRMSLAKEIQKRATEKIRCFVQVNASGEQSKHGLTPEEVVPFIEKLTQYPSVEVVGLMTMAPFVEDAESLRPIFKKMKQLQQSIAAKRWEHAPCRELSMGMSNDFQIAIEEGATFVRIGTALVGKEF
jgi:pyridoxal phosphate enzyme (YggS family)